MFGPLVLALTLTAPTVAPPDPPPPATLHLPQAAEAPALALSLDEAIKRGLENNVAALLAEANVDESRGRRWQALSSLLPHASASASAVHQKINLAAFGFSAPGIPDIIGPFDVFDGRVSVTQTVVDMAAIDRARAEADRLAASRHDQNDARRLVALVVTNLYLDAITASSRVDAGKAELESARTLLRLAEDRKAAGVVPRIDVLRAEVQYEGAEQRQIALENAFEKAKLTLAQAIGLTPVTSGFVLSDHLQYTPAAAMTVDQALAEARDNRLDARAAAARVSAAEKTLRAARDGRLPSLQVHADYGTIGNTMELAHPTFAVGAAVAIPIFDGQLIHGRVVEAQGELARARAEASDLEGRIVRDVQAALLDLTAAERRVQVAQHTVQLAAEQQTQAADRFKAGVANNIEVVQAQAAVAAANDAYIAGLASHNLAKAALARAVGRPAGAFTQFLGGEQQ